MASAEVLRAAERLRGNPDFETILEDIRSTRGRLLEALVDLRDMQQIHRVQGSAFLLQELLETLGPSRPT